MQSDLKSVQSDTTLDEESKSTQVSLLESQISTIQSQISSIQSENSSNFNDSQSKNQQSNKNDDINRGDVVVSGNLNTLIEATRSGDTDTINKLKAQSNSEQNNTYSSF